ncbi:MAG: SCO family protein [Armatimonadetes bacterium]|nr:SCO family protein [Armatimonadota bacterium]
MAMFFLVLWLAAVPAAGQDAGVEVGSEVPDFTLVDQDSRSVSLKAFRGKVVLVTFLYTKCPFPDKCPMIAQKLGQTRELIDSLKDGRKEFQVISITLDPERDTPEALKAYARGNDKAFPNWTFLTGKPEQIARVTALFGVVYWKEKGIIEHNLRTAIIDRKGRLHTLLRGSDWKAGEIAARIKAVLEQKS